MAIHHLNKPHQPLQLALDFHDNQSHRGCVAIHEDSLYRPPTTHLAFRMGMMSHHVLRPKSDAHRMYAQDQVVIHTARM
jgi:hypothetical protein